MSKIVIGADVDGTLSKPNHDVTDDNIELCRGMEGLGIPIVLSTGKALDYAWRNACRFGGKAVFVENHAVWSQKPGEYKIYGPNLGDLVELRRILGLTPKNEGVCEITLGCEKGQVAIEEGKHGVLTLFVEPKLVKHRWKFQQKWNRCQVYENLWKIIRVFQLASF